MDKEIMELNKAAICLLALLAAASTARAGSYVPQATFNIPAGYIKGMDTDSGGTLYVLSLASGKSTYWVSSYQTPGITPLFSFDTGVSSPTAFAVEASGVVDILDGSGGAGAILLKRFQNNGAFIGQTQYSLSTPWLSSAIDKNGRVLLSTEFWMTWYCTWVCSKPNGNYGNVYAYDFTGKLLTTFTLPGNSTSGGCYAPSRMTVDPQGNVYVADLVCNNLLKYSSSGALLTQTPFQGWAYNAGFQGMWTDPASDIYISQPSGVAKFDSNGNALASLAPNPPVGDGWDGRILYLPSSGGSPLQRWIYDGAPSVPTETSPLSAVSQHSAAATLNWQASTDPDGDPVTYSVYLGASPSQLSFIGSTTQTSFPTPSLSFGVPYYWQVVAQDSYLGLPLLTQSAPVVSFSLNFVNNPPGPFVVAGGTGTAITRSTSLTMQWNVSTDPDGDPVVYDVYWRTAGQPSAALIGTTTSTFWNMTGLAFGSTYYWFVTARDPYGATTSMTGGEQAYDLIFQNSPPSPVVYLSTSSAYNLHTTSPNITLSWAPSTDPDGDPVSYQLEIQTNTGPWPATALGAAMSFPLSAQLETTYYWRVDAADPYGGVSTGAWLSFIVHLANRPPNPIVYTTTATLTTRATSYALTWQDTGDPDGDFVTYSLFLSSNPAQQFLVQQGTQTAWPLSFQFGATYYWSVSATDSFGARTDGPLQSFLPIFKNSPPAVPLNQSNTGTIPYHSLAPTQSFFWQPSTDPDGDPFGYSLYFGTDATRLSITTSVPLGFAFSGLAVNTAYYYKIVATDIFGASSPSPINWVYYEFQNNPPGPFGVAGGTGTIVTRDSSQTLSWTPSVDPDGDPVAYRVFLGTMPASLSNVADTALTYYTLSDLAFSATYYWSVEAHDSFGATITVTGGLQSVAHVFRDSTPSSIVYLSTTSSYNLHTVSPNVTLAWQPASNAQGDAVAYSLQVNTSSGPWLSTALGSSTVVTLAPQFETTYYWSITAADPYGGASTGAWMSFVVHFQNSPPNPFGAVSGMGTDVTRSTYAALSWQSTGDPDGDPVQYELFLGTNPAAVGGGTSPVILSTNIYVLNGLVYGTTYYWNVVAIDPFGAQAPMAQGTQSYLPIFKSDLPVPIPGSAASLPSGTMRSAGNSVLLTWPAYSDPAGGTVAYTLYAGQGTLVPVYQGTENSYVLNGLSYGTQYAYKIEAAGADGASDGPAGNFTLTPDSVQSDPYNFPNPFHVAQGTDFVYTALSQVDSVRLSVYSAYQRLVWSRDLGAVGPGVQRIHWDGNDSSGHPVFSGLYVAVFETPQGRRLVRMVGVK